MLKLKPILILRHVSTYIITLHSFIKERATIPHHPHTPLLHRYGARV